tara:strand:+ start:285 stop:548 length:264 start_codon:yes stop_codon:yes gene_type:complete
MLYETLTGEEAVERLYDPCNMKAENWKWRIAFLKNEGKAVIFTYNGGDMIAVISSGMAFAFNPITNKATGYFKISSIPTGWKNTDIV